MKSPQRSFSFTFDSNPLTKRMYNVADTALSRTPITGLKKAASSLSYSAQTKTRPIQKRSFLKTFYSRFEPQTEVQTPKASSPMKNSKVMSATSFQSLTQPSIKPKFTLLKIHRHKRQQTNPQIHRWDTNIKKWENINKRLQRLLPPPIIKVEKKKPPKLPIVVTREKVRELTDDLTKHLEHFWGISGSAQKMTSFLREIQGFNQTIANVLMKNGLFKRIENPSEIYRFFEIFKKQEDRSEDFTSADLKLHSALDYFCIKMEQRVKGCHHDFSERLKMRIAVQTHSLQHKIKVMEKKNIREHTSTMKFLANKRLYLNKYTKDDTLKKLQEMGVKFSIKQRMKDKIISSRELASQAIVDTLLRNSRTLTYKVESPNKYFGPNAQRF